MPQGYEDLQHGGPVVASRFYRTEDPNVLVNPDAKNPASESEVRLGGVAARYLREEIAISDRPGYDGFTPSGALVQIKESADGARPKSVRRLIRDAFKDASKAEANGFSAKVGSVLIVSPTRDYPDDRLFRKIISGSQDNLATTGGVDGEYFERILVLRDGEVTGELRWNWDKSKYETVGI